MTDEQAAEHIAELLRWILDKNLSSSVLAETIRDKISGLRKEPGTVPLWMSAHG